MADRAQWERREQGLAAEVAALQAQLEAKQTEQAQCSPRLALAVALTLTPTLPLTLTLNPSPNPDPNPEQAQCAAHVARCDAAIKVVQTKFAKSAQRLRLTMPLHPSLRCAPLSLRVPVSEPVRGEGG